MAELGWLGIPFDEKDGGAGLGLAELAIVVEALGRKLAPEPIARRAARDGRRRARPRRLGGRCARRGFPG